MYKPNGKSFMVLGILHLKKLQESGEKEGAQDIGGSIAKDGTEEIREIRRASKSLWSMTWTLKQQY